MKFTDYLIAILAVILAVFCFCSVIYAGEPFNNLPPYIGDGRKGPAVSKMEIKELVIPPLSVPELAIPELESPELKVEEISFFTPLPIDALQTGDIQAEVDKTEMQRFLLRLLVDRRNAFDSKVLNLNAEILSKWAAIYKEPVYPISYVEPPKGLRMIAEVRMPLNEIQAETLKDNLNYRHAQGFNAVLLTFNGSEELGDLVALAKYLKRGFKVWFAFSGREDLREPVFIDPDAYALYLQTLASVCDGFLSHWRRTSSHLFIQDDAFMYYTALNVRAGNPEIPVLGEVYFGETAQLDTKTSWYKAGERANLVIRMTAGGSGYVVTNFAAPGINVEGVLGGLLKPIEGAAKYVLISGPYPYFLTTNKHGTTYEEDLQGIRALEERWLAAGAWGSIVTHADGTDFGHGIVTDNMSAYSYKEIKKE